MNSKCRSLGIKDAPGYRWGSNCEAWRLVDEPDMSVIAERLPAGATESMHLHRRVRQLFFVLEGEVSVEAEGAILRATRGQAVHVPAGVPHRVFNSGDEDLDLLVVSSSPARLDREESNASRPTAP